MLKYTEQPAIRVQLYIYKYSILETKNTAVGIHCADHATPSICSSWH
jgi:hypothetical protein